MFVLWWHALAGSSALGALSLTLYMAGALPIWLHQSISQLSLLLIVAALLGLLYYLIYLYTGSHGALKPLLVGYLLFYVSIIGLVQWIGAPDSLTDNGWSIMAEPESELPTAVSWLFLVFLVGPQIIASIAYLRLYGKATDVTQRYRIALVSGAIIAWFGSSLVASAAELGTSLVWQVISRLLGLAAAFVILSAYLPPAWVQRRLHVRSIIEEAA